MQLDFGKSPSSAGSGFPHAKNKWKYLAQLWLLRSGCLCVEPQLSEYSRPWVKWVKFLLPMFPPSPGGAILTTCLFCCSSGQDRSSCGRA